MLLWSLVILAVVMWFGIWALYFRAEIFAWFDNRFGPAHVPKKVAKPPRRRMYD
jgi:NADH:ubiquinone oxidoreductase subunit H